MNISRFFIDRPIFAGVLSLMVMIAGLLAMFQLPISEYPEVTPPSVVVNASFPGANPKVIAESVATPLEEQLSGVENMIYMSSQATSDGRMTLTVTFKIGTDPDLAQQMVQNRISQALPRLPEVTRQLGVTVVKSSPDLTLVVHLVSAHSRQWLVSSTPMSRLPNVIAPRAGSQRDVRGEMDRWANGPTAKATSTSAQTGPGRRGCPMSTPKPVDGGGCRSTGEPRKRPARR